MAILQRPDSRWFGIAFVAALLLLATACSGNEPLTFEEYVAWCAEQQESDDLSLPELGPMTWGEATDLLEERLDDLTSVDPPEEVEEYHRGSIAAWQAMVAATRAEDESETFNAFTFLAAGLIAAGIAEEARESLSNDARSALQDAGCLSPDDSNDTSSEQSDNTRIDRSVVAVIGDRITVERSRSEDRFEMIVRGRPRRTGDVYSIPVTVIAIADEWTYENSAWTDEQIELVSEPDENGRIYKLTETTQFWDRPVGSLEGVILVVGGQHDGALYFPAGDAPAGTQFVELRYPAGDVRRGVDLSR